MEQSHVITQLLGIKDPHITFSKEIHDMKTHKELKAVLDYDAPPCPNCQSQMGKYDFQRESKVPFLDCAGYKTLIRLKKRRFKCQFCGKITVAETSLVPKNHQIPTIVKQKVAQLLIEKVSMTAIADRLSISTSTVMRKLNEFTFKSHLTYYPNICPGMNMPLRRAR